MGLIDDKFPDNAGTSQSNMNTDEPIAIVGLAMRLPGQVNSTEEFWDMLINKKDGRCAVPLARYDAESIFGPTKGPVVGNFLQEDPACFDAQFFSISAQEAAQLDPQQRLLLEVVWECLENAGETNWRGTDVGVYVGVFGEDWLELSLRSQQRASGYQAIATGGFALSNRISYEFDLRGPCMTIQTGCSATLVGLHEACQALKLRHCSGAIVAGTNLIVTPTMTESLSAASVLSPSGTCRTFDANANGYARGEAVNAIYIKRLSDAVRDGDPVRAIIRSSTVNCDGRTIGMMNPSSQSQEVLIRNAYQHAGLSGQYDQTGLFECHGTGTVVGDSVETAAIANVFGEKGVVISSVKPNFGHSEGASGVTSVIKAVLTLEHRAIPPSAHYETRNPNIPVTLQVPTALIPWPQNRLPRVSINSFGVGGTNAHAILDAASRTIPQREAGSGGDHHSQLIILSAKGSGSLRDRIDTCINYVNNHTNALSDISFTLGVRREHLSHRAFAIASPDIPLEISAFETGSTRSRAPVVTFVFTGQGAQWAGMGRELLQTDIHFAAAVGKMDKALQELYIPPKWSLKEELGRDPMDSQIHEVDLAQPLCTALQIALCDTLAARGIVPESVIGHSSGEMAAAYAAGAVSAACAITTAYYRGKMAASQDGLGTMAAVGLSQDQATEYLQHGVVVACVNSPRNVTLSGDKEGMQEVLARIKAQSPDTFCKRLRNSVAYHSPHMTRVGVQYERAITPHIAHGPQMRPMFSTLTGDIITDPGQIDAGYWRRNLESPVLFSAAVQTLLRQSEVDRVFVEIGPHSALAAPLQEIFKLPGKIKIPAYIPTLIRNDNDCRSLLLTTMGRLFSHGLPLDMGHIFPQGRVLTDLPRYPWQHDKQYWKESRSCREWRLRSTDHELLGSRIPEATTLEPSWRKILHLDDVPWLTDHVIAGEITFPGTGYVAMAGEAVQQLQPEASGYSMRNVQFKAALLLDPNQETEILTHLKPIEVADGVASSWYQFTISAYDGSGWILHCQGQVRAGHEQPLQPKAIHPLPRSLPSAKWYRMIEKVGMKCGPTFQGLRDITADPRCPAAVTTITDPDELHTRRGRYILHPTSLDQCLQSIVIATTSGLLSPIATALLPVAIENISVSCRSPAIQVAASSQDGPRGHFGEVTGMDREGVVLTMNGVYMLNVGRPASSKAPLPLVSRMELRPDIDLVSPTQLLPSPSDRDGAHDLTKLTNFLSRLCILAIARRIDVASNNAIELAKWRSFILERNGFTSDPTGTKLERWVMATDSGDPCIRITQAKLRAMAAAIGEDEQRTYRGWPRWEALSSDGLEDFVRQLINDISTLMRAHSPLIECLALAFEYGIGFANGTRSPTLLGQTDSLLEPLYDICVRSVDWNTFLSVLSHSNPGLRILEVGAGTGSATREALKSLKSRSAAHMYSQYVLTDVSGASVSAAQERFKTEANMEFKTLDISRNPEEQGFDQHSFDLVIVSYALHAVPSLQTSLAHIRKLLCSQGRLLLHEATNDMEFFDHIMGTLTGWWFNQPNRPLTSSDIWDQELRTAGFTGTDAIASDPIGSISILSSSSYHLPRLGEITILAPADSHPPWVEKVSTQFEKQGYTVQYTTVDNPPGQGQFVICLLDIDTPYLDPMTEDEFSTFRKYLIAAEDTRLLWVTQATHLTCENPGFGTIHGLARSLRQEMELDISLLEVDRWDSRTAGAIVSVCEKIHAARDRLDTDQDYEFVLVDGAVHVPRSHRSTFPQELSFMPAADSPRFLTIGSTGHLDTVQWVPLPPVAASLGSGEVEVDVEYVGLNFRDLLVLLGHLGTVNECGLEASGVVRQVGPGVTELKSGDRVSMINSGLCRTRVRLDHQLVRRVPDGLSLQDAAGMGVVYMTALHSLINVGNLQKGQSVLIHSAAGGLGIAAIHTCKMIGAKIYATVGTPEKLEYLVETFQIPREQIFNSRDNSFLPDLMQATNGRGVDIVLNSLAGPLLHASWECVAAHGKMIELGKRDFLTHGVLNMSPFISNRTFVGVDLMGVLKERPDIGEQIHQIFSEGVRNGSVTPIRPVQVFDAAQAVDGLRYLQTGTHMGKLVLRIPSDNSSSLTCTPTRALPTFHSDRSYLLVGGLGGIGSSVSSWMAKHGARYFVYLSRTAGELEDHVCLIRELEAQDCHVICVKGTVTSLADVANTVSRCPRPLAGIVQMAGILKDRTFPQMTYEDWSLALEPKVTGTWNIHHATKDLALDFFIMVGSISGTVGVGGQTNYAAANTFLDAFAQYRRSNGLVASVVNLSLVDDIVGIANQHPDARDMAIRSHTHTLSENDVLHAFHLAILEPEQKAAGRCSFSVGVGHANPPVGSLSKYMWGQDARFSLHKNRQLSTSAGGSEERENKLKDLLMQVEQEPTLLNKQGIVDAIKTGMAKAVAEESAGHRDMDAEQHKALQIDSLMAVEIHTSLRRSLKLDLPTPEIINAGTVGELCILLIFHLRRKYKLDDAALADA